MEEEEQRGYEGREQKGKEERVCSQLSMFEILKIPCL